MPTKRLLSEIYGNKRLIFRIIFAVFSLLVMLAIFFFSAQNGDSSSNTSGKVIAGFLKTFHNGFKEMTEPERLQLVKSLQFIIRKCAHFSIYFLLGINVFGLFTTFSFSRFKTFGFAWAFCILYAASDEFHQLFSSGRSGSIKDVILDSCGSLCAILIFLLVLLLIIKRTSSLLVKENHMRKKLLIEQNTLLTEKLIETNKEINRLNNSLYEANDKISLLEKRIEELQSFSTKVVEENVILSEPATEQSQDFNEARVKDFSPTNFEKFELKQSDTASDEDYAVGVLAKIVLEASKADIVLSSKKGVGNDLKKSVLGMAEVSKAEIFNILSQNDGSISVKEKIDEEYQKTKKYIEEILNTIS